MDSLFKVIVVCLWIIYKDVQTFDLEIDQRDLFPYPAYKLFSIFIVRKDGEGPLNASVVDTMVIQILNMTNRAMLDRAIFDYGFKDMIDQPYKGQFITISNWSKETKESRETINANVLFMRNANGHLLQIFQIETKSKSERRLILNNLENQAKLLLEEKIQLLIPPRIELKINPSDGRNNEVMLGYTTTARCRSFDGIPRIDPIFLDLSEFDVIKNDFDIVKNEREVQFRVSSFDHEKKLRCRSGETVSEAVILVLHHPSQVTLDPEPGDLLENGSSIVCLKADGYPSPFIRWTFISGPPNASHFYTITGGGIRFNLLKDAPLRSRWTLNCTASNIIPGSIADYNRTVKFTVGRPQEGLFDRLNLTTQLIIGVVVVGAIVLFCVMIVIIICIIRRCCISRPTNSSRKNGGPIKASSKEKVGPSIACYICVDQDSLPKHSKEKPALEAEQVTLLPPGAPPNYVDLSNSAAGLPPPPPEYELMTTDATKVIHKEIEGSSKYNDGPAKYHDGQVKYNDGPAKYNEGSVKYRDGSIKYSDGSIKYNDGSMKYGEGSLKYNEVTYAELNTSNLPMKNNTSPQASCSDDQVIYSQIVGTVLNPYSSQRSYTEPNNV